MMVIPGRRDGHNHLMDFIGWQYRRSTLPVSVQVDVEGRYLDAWSSAGWELVNGSAGTSLEGYAVIHYFWRKRASLKTSVRRPD